MDKTNSLQLDSGVYQGETNLKNQPSGFGKIIFKNGNCFKGEWKNGNIHGNGKFYFSSGNIYIGNFLYNLKNGYGTFFYVNAKEKYQGHWKNDLKHGKGKYFHANGNIFQGVFKNDKKNGLGRIYSQNFIFTGIWINGKKHGMFKRENLKTKQICFIKYDQGKKVEMNHVVLKIKESFKENNKINHISKNTLSIVKEDIQKEENISTSIYSRNNLLLFNDTTSIFSSNLKLNEKKSCEKKIYTLKEIFDYPEKINKNKYKWIPKSLTCLDTD